MQATNGTAFFFLPVLCTSSAHRSHHKKCGNQAKSNRQPCHNCTHSCYPHALLMFPTRAFSLFFLLLDVCSVCDHLLQRVVQCTKQRKIRAAPFWHFVRRSHHLKHLHSLVSKLLSPLTIYKPICPSIQLLARHRSESLILFCNRDCVEIHTSPTS